jgi:hypothetical protein
MIAQFQVSNVFNVTSSTASARRSCLQASVPLKTRKASSLRGLKNEWELLRVCLSWLLLFLDSNIAGANFSNFCSSVGGAPWRAATKSHDDDKTKPLCNNGQEGSVVYVIAVPK